jgi:hypothetical protein
VEKTSLRETVEQSSVLEIEVVIAADTSEESQSSNQKECEPVLECETAEQPSVLETAGSHLC